MNIGTIIQWGSNTIPTGWLLCDGSAISRTTYSDLFSVIGTSFGAGDGSTTFNLPDLRGKVAVGKDTNDTDFDTLGDTGGSKYLQEHTHSISKGGQGFVTDSGGYAGVMGDWGAFNTSGVQGVTTGNSGNLQPYVTLNYIIKVTTPDTIKISELTELTSADSTDLIPIVDISADETKKISFNNLTKDVYSTSEIKTNKVWIDGKSIYRKVITGTRTSGNNYTVDFELSSLSSIVKIDIYAICQNTNLAHGIYRMDDTDQLRYYIDDNSALRLVIMDGTSHPAKPYDYVVIAEYTKTTD